MKWFIVLPLAVCFSASVYSSPIQIRGMAGCYEVTFEFKETFLRKKDHPIRSEDYKERGLEWVEVDFEQGDEIHLQHILLTPNGPLKHWRQEWKKQPSFVWTFHGRTRFEDLNSSLLWTKASVETGLETWVQRVTQVDDSPRYECAANWVNTHQTVFWECQSPAPLPRREFSKRGDYDVLMRRNRHEITSDGWIHEQDNKKIQSRDQVLLAEEKGINTYRRVDDSNCESAKQWWAENKRIWHFVQDHWRHLQETRSEIRLKEKVNNINLWARLFDWTERNKSSEISDDLKAELRQLIEEHIE